MSSVPAWMPFYPGDYLADTSHLTTEQHGAYFLLLLAIWRRGGKLPNDELQLSRIAGLSLAQWRRMRITILAFFLIADREITHKRVNAELAKAALLAERSRVNGKSGGRPKGKPRDNPEETQQEPSGLSVGILDETQTITQTKARAPVPQPQSQEEKNSVPNGTGARGAAVEPMKALFDFGRSVLCESGISDKQARGLVGKWRSAIGDDGRLMAILVSARKNHAQEPVSYIEAALKKDAERAKFGGGYVPQHPGAGG